MSYAKSKGFNPKTQEIKSITQKPISFGGKKGGSNHMTSLLGKRGNGKGKY